ncbi:hypothetical protein EYC58_02365 [Candidatus Saccharibacteria bacterium]|nr:MAG: hypothetical protein EYC58_02365 [Candidatus Saccharibacteria bacterium]
MNYTEFVLPPSVVTKVDVARLVAEIERVDDELTTSAVRAKSGASQTEQLSLSPQLTEFMNHNTLRPNTSNERTELIKQMRLMKDKLPTIHMTFAVEADRQSLQQLAAWLRASVHPQAVIAVGLQPALIAGVYLRTPNQVRDLSLRAMLKGGRGLLLKDLAALRGGTSGGR